MVNSEVTCTCNGEYTTSDSSCKCNKYHLENGTCVDQCTNFFDESFKCIDSCSTNYIEYTEFGNTVKRCVSQCPDGFLNLDTENVKRCTCEVSNNQEFALNERTP